MRAEPTSELELTSESEDACLVSKELGRMHVVHKVLSDTKFAPAKTGDDVNSIVKFTNMKLSKHTK